MNKLKELARRYIFSDELPLDARMINVICAVGLASAILATVARVVTRADAMMIVIMLAISLSIGLFLIVCNRYHLYRVSTWITLIALCDILFPVAFFMLGGSDSGMAAFFVIGLAVIVILSRGFIRVLLISTNVFLVVSCYVIAYRLPFLTFELDPLGQTLDNIQSFLISGFFIGLVVLFQHIMYDAERRKAESSARKLEIARQSIVTMFESNPHINILFNENFDIIDCNPAAVKFLKFSSKEEMLSGFAELIPNIIPKIQPEGRESIPMSKRLRAAADNGSVKFVTALRVDGETKTLNVEMRRLPYGNGFAIVGHIVDLTAIHQARRDIMRRDMLSQAVSDAATLLLSPDIDRFESSLMSGMEKMALCVDVDRVYIWKNHVENGVLVYKREFQWLSERTEDGRSEVEKQPFKFPYIDSIPEWEAKFSSGQVVRGPVSELSLTEREVLSAYGVKSILAIPIILDDKFWGFVSFDDCRKEREFSDAEEGILRSGCLLLANAIMRNENDRVLKKRLEQQALMSDISQSFISKENTSDLVNGALRKMGEFLGVTRVLIVVSDEKSGETHPAYMWAGSDKIETRPVLTGINELIGGSFPKLLPSRGSIPTVRCGDISSEEKFSPLSATGLISFIWAPLYVDGRYWGLLSVEECFKPRDWSESDAQLAGMVSGAVSGAVARDLMDRERSKALEQAVQASRAKGEFLSNMSHEMRTPMNAIIGMTSIGKSAPSVERKDYAFKKIGDASTHLLGVINDILDMSKIEANKLELSFSEFDFEKTLQKSVDVINFRVEEKLQNLTVYIDKKIPHSLIGDEQRLSQVITNLLSNAVKFTRERGSIRLDANLEEENEGLCTILVKVTDSGIGISSEQQARLFKSFEQAENNTSRKFGGTGLGLAISKRIVEMMGGSIWIESELGMGATFAFTIQARRGVSKRRKTMLNPGINWKNIRALVVDDSEEIREQFADISRGLGLTCDVARNGDDAIARVAQKGPYDVYFVDWKMPGMNGIELSSRIKETGSDKSVVIMISSVEWSVIEDEAKSAGVDKFLPKPLFPSSIADCVNECLGVGSQIDADREEHKDNALSLDGFNMLLAEDVEVNREIVLAMLEPTMLSIDCAENGAEAVKLFSEAPDLYDMIFMDVQMPEMDGYEATRRIRELEASSGRHVPIVAMTANVFREDVERCLASGMNDHIGKPLDLGDLLSKLRKYLLRSN